MAVTVILGGGPVLVVVVGGGRGGGEVSLMTASLAAAENVSMEMGEGEWAEWAEWAGMWSRCAATVVLVLMDPSPVSAVVTAAGMSLSTLGPNTS